MMGSGEFTVIRRCALGKNLKSHIDGLVLTALLVRIKDVGFFQRKPGDILAATVCTRACTRTVASPF